MAAICHPPRINSYLSLRTEFENMDQFVATAEPKRIQLLSEPFVVFTRWGYQPVVLVMPKKSKNLRYLFISPRTLAVPLETLRENNEGQLTGIEIWIRKVSDDKRSPYALEAL